MIDVTDALKADWADFENRAAVAASDYLRRCAGVRETRIPKDFRYVAPPKLRRPVATTGPAALTPPPRELLDVDPPRDVEDRVDAARTATQFLCGWCGRGFQLPDGHDCPKRGAL